MKTMFLAIMLLVSVVSAKDKPVTKHKVVTFTDIPFDVVSFEKNVRPVLLNRCATCHYDGSSLLNLLQYSIAKENGSKLKSNIASGRMPMRNLTGISDVERYIIQKWVDEGMKP
jgi:uncharacterized membrane protein